MRVHFHLGNGGEEILDEEGVEVSSIAEAYVMALETLLEDLYEDPTSAGKVSGWTLYITDQAGLVLKSILLGRSTSQTRAFAKNLQRI